MNLEKLKHIIESYKSDFSVIHKKEIYKWRSVKFFQENWNINELDFTKMLLTSIREARNLLDSGQYFPRRMLTQYAEQRPQEVKRLFAELYNEDIDLTTRMGNFQMGIEKLNKELFPGKKSYHDQRAVIVYLCLRYPERYFLYKYEMFKSFCEKVDYPYVPKMGKSENIIQYLTLCSLIREELLKDNSLIKLHQGRLEKDHYSDTSLNILTQDIIYAAVKHIEVSQDKFESIGVDLELIPNAFSVVKKEPTLKGRFVNYIDNERENKRIGDLGELAILEYERDLLKKCDIHNFEPIHKSKNEGDGLGYDILSMTPEGDPKYIEVKTTKSTFDKPFYVTKSELVRSIQDKSKFYLYRLFEFNEKTKHGKLLIIRGDLTPFCINPVNYSVSLTKVD